MVTAASQHSGRQPDETATAPDEVLTQDRVRRWSERGVGTAGQRFAWAARLALLSTLLILNPPIAGASELSPEEQAALRLACRTSAGTSGEQPCRERALTEAAGVPRPRGLAFMSFDEKLRLDAACAAAQELGPAELRRCQARELQRLAAVMSEEPAAEPGQENVAAVEVEPPQPSPPAPAPRKPRQRSTRASVEPAAAPTITGVPSVIDGDTLDIRGIRIRFHGIDAPESAQSCEMAGRSYRCGQGAALALDELIRRRPITCEERDRDRYGRIVAVCRLDGRDLNAAMVRQGEALAYREYSRDYEAEEEVARAARVGLWRGTFTEPWVWRAQKRRGELPKAAEGPAKPAPPPASPAPREEAGRVLVVSGKTANLRSEPTTKAAIVARLRRGDAVRELRQEDRWYLVRLDAGTEGWVYGNLVHGQDAALEPAEVPKAEPRRPTRVARPAPEVTTAAPRAAPAPTWPARTQSAPPPPDVLSILPPSSTQPRRSRAGSSAVAGGFQCSGKRTCGAMSSCAEARFYLESCGVYRLDRDGDGVPCESIC